MGQPQTNGDGSKFSLTPNGALANEWVELVKSEEHIFTSYLVLRNIRWFIQLRWLIATVFIVLSGLAHVGAAASLGLSLSSTWLFILGLALIGLNICYEKHRRHMLIPDPAGMMLNLWMQIFFDLLAITVVVHNVGSLSSFSPFLYTIHITMACIFFPPHFSLVVVILSSLFFGGCIVLESAGTLTEQAIFGTPLALTAIQRTIHAGSAILLWTAVWYMASRLSDILQTRDAELVDSQNKIQKTFRISQKHMQQAAHQMKSPLGAIQSNLMLLDMELGENQSERAKDLMERIHNRCDNVQHQVRDILNLGNLRVGENLTRSFREVPIHNLLQACVDEHKSQADERSIRIKADLKPLCFQGDIDALKMMLENLVSNAINYSKDRGKVIVYCRPSEEGMPPIIKIRDEGIGIPEDKLPEIFDDYFRTPEAKKHCRHSTGMGLSIVKYAASMHAIHIDVQSKVDEGTMFTLYLPQESETVCHYSTSMHVD